MPRLLLLATALLATATTACFRPSGAAPTTPKEAHLGASDLDVALPAHWESRIGEDNGVLHDELVHRGDDAFIMISLHTRTACGEGAPGAARPDYLPEAFRAGRTEPRVGGYQDVYACMRRDGGDLTARITVQGPIDDEAAEVREVLAAIADAG